MSVFCEKKRNQLGVYGIIRTEVSTEKAADKVSIYRSVVAREMYVFKIAVKAFKIGS
jgi:hypothetical protein